MVINSVTNPKRILVVDDDTSVLSVWTRFLTSEGFDVVTAATGEEAIQILKDQTFAVMFTDINMPGISGKDLLKYVKQKHSATCVNMITGLVTIEGAVECMQLGACDYLSKPCEKKELTAMAFRCLRHYDQELESRRLKETVFRLEEVDKLKAQFVSNVSHELRTPLFAIAAALEILLQDMYESLSDPMKQLCDVMRNNIERLRRLIENILNFSRLENGTLHIKPRELDLSNLIKETTAGLAPLFARREIDFVFETNPSPFTTRFTADPEQIQHVLINLLGNAIKFTPEKGKVGIKLEDQGNDIRICVWDTGPGIDQHDQKRIFDRFYQVDGSSTRETGGTGIGLSIVKAVVEMHGGNAWVESELGKGSQFYISLPKQPIQKEGETP